MRLYTFTNMYLSSLQVGLQSAHLTAELFNNYTGDCLVQQQLRDWSENHKTMIFLNGGYSSNLHELYSVMKNKQNTFPFAKFHEGEDALDGALTCVGIVLPERIYVTASALRDPENVLTDSELELTGAHVHCTYENDLGSVWNINRWEHQFIKRLNRFGMAS